MPLFAVFKMSEDGPYYSLPVHDKSRAEVDAWVKNVAGAKETLEWIPVKATDRDDACRIAKEKGLEYAEKPLDEKALEHIAKVEQAVTAERRHIQGLRSNSDSAGKKQAVTWRKSVTKPKEPNIGQLSEEEYTSVREEVRKEMEAEALAKLNLSQKGGREI